MLTLTVTITGKTMFDLLTAVDELYTQIADNKQADTAAVGDGFTLYLSTTGEEEWEDSDWNDSEEDEDDPPTCPHPECYDPSCTGDCGL